LFHAIEALKLPCLIFINKIDRVGADSQAIYDEIKGQLNSKCLILQQVTEEGTDNVRIVSLFNHQNQSTAEIIETIVEQDDDLLESFLEGQEITNQQLLQSLKYAVAKQHLIPVLIGSAK
jgi:ribosomal protection tetracycline resistance protein